MTGKPYVAFVSHGGGGSAIKSVEKLAARFRLKKVANYLSAQGRPSKEDLEKARELGRTLAKSAK